MRAVRFHEHGSPDVLQVDEITPPTPGAGELQIEVRAAGINPVDTYFRDGSFEPPSLPMIPGVDVSGVVSETGTNVTEFAVGDRVFGTGIGGPYAGTAAEYVVAPIGRVAQLSANVSFEDASAAGIAALTPWRAIVDHAALEPGEYCFIHGGSGGVGHVAVQIAAEIGSRVVTTASESHHRRVRELGAHAVFDYDREDLRDVALDATEGGADVIVDHMPERYLQFDCDIADQHGRIVLYRNSNQEAGFSDVQAAGTKELQFQAMSALNTPDIAARLTKIERLLSDGQLEINVDETYGFDDVATAHQRVRDESFLGKLVVMP